MTPLEVAQAHAGGATYRALAADLGVTVYAVSRMILTAERETGLRFRRRRGRRPGPAPELCALCQGIVRPGRAG